MVVVSLKPPPVAAQSRNRSTTLTIFASSVLCVVWVYGSSSDMVQLPEISNPQSTEVNETRSVDLRFDHCPIPSIAALSKDELEPTKGSRHMVDPPKGGKLSLVCCETTKGKFSALLHHTWAPLGVARLVHMIQSQYFSTRIPLYRCTDACQFGFSGDPEATKRFDTRLQDDPMWQPPGKDFRKNEKTASSVIQREYGHMREQGQIRDRTSL